jgi:nucleoside-diphosphate-sugar epimerase
VEQKVLVTGAAGYLGSVLCERLLDEGFGVVALDNLSYGEQSLFHLCSDPRFEFVFGDARDKTLVRDLLLRCDAVIPLACLVGAPACDRSPEAARSINLEAVQMVNRLRSPTQPIVFPTTNSGYGTRSGDVVCTEETPLEPISLYGRTKVEAEADVLAAPGGITFRLATVFGLSPRMRLDLLVNHFVHAAVTEGYLVVFEKAFRRNYVHIRDVADAFVFALRNVDRLAGRAFNLGLDAANLSKEELALKIQEHIPGFYVHFAEVGSDPDKRDYLVSNERLKIEGFEARRSLDDGIRELIKGYRLLGRKRFSNV